MKKAIRSLGLLSAVAVILTACGNAGEDTAASSKHLEVFSQKKEMTTQLQQIIDGFNEEYEAEAELVSVPDPGTVLKTRISNNDAPDIINIYPQNADFQLWANDDQFVDLTEEPFLDKLIDGAAEQYAVNDKIYNLPLTTNAWGFFYNLDKFEELGLEVPESWEEFEQLVADIQEAGEIPFAGSFSTQDSWTLNGFHQLAWATAAGGAEEANEYLRFSEKDAISADDAVTQDVAKQLSLLVGTAQPNANGASYADAVAAFAKGKALILPNGIWALPAINEQQPEFTVRSFAYPGKELGEAYTVGAADLAFSISSQSDNQELAKQFLDYISRPEVLDIYYQVDGMPTSLEEMQDQKGFEETEGVTRLAFTENQMIWLQKDWDSEESFWGLTVDFINSGGDIEQLEKSLNEVFNPMKN